jgi:23S rRNA (cytidine1920-2'-O)/16S rRNA (cytidine1409-2'-O)-methyltransferase
MATTLRGCASWRNFWFSDALEEAPAVSPSSHRKLKTENKRLDVLLVERGLAESRQRAQALILAGSVRVAGQKVTKAGTPVPVDGKIDITGAQLRYASRGGLKLEGALEDLGVDPAGKICLDAGSSTGGFTDCLLQRGARLVYAVDVSVDQLDWKLAQDTRVVQIEKNVRYLAPEDLKEPVDLLTLDLSFISVAKVLTQAGEVVRPGGEFLILVKPQFELERGDVGKGGIVRDPALHERAIARVRVAAEKVGLHVLGVRPSRITGAEGNQEFFVHARRESLG